jgi:hypothetical protein
LRKSAEIGSPRQWTPLDARIEDWRLSMVSFGFLESIVGALEALGPKIYGTQDLEMALLQVVMGQIRCVNIIIMDMQTGLTSSNMSYLSYFGAWSRLWGSSEVVGSRSGGADIGVCTQISPAAPAS